MKLSKLKFRNIISGQVNTDDSRTYTITFPKGIKTYSPFLFLDILKALIPNVSWMEIQYSSCKRLFIGSIDEMFYVIHITQTGPFKFIFEGNGFEEINFVEDDYEADNYEEHCYDVDGFLCSVDILGLINILKIIKRNLKEYSKEELIQFIMNFHYKTKLGYDLGVGIIKLCNEKYGLNINLDDDNNFIINSYVNITDSYRIESYVDEVYDDNLDDNLDDLFKVKNFLQETIKILKENNKKEEDILWVGNNENYTTWRDFKEVICFEYEYEKLLEEKVLKSGFKIVGEDWWLEPQDILGNYLVYRELPKKPKEFKKYELDDFMDKEEMHRLK